MKTKLLFMFVLVLMVVFVWFNPDGYSREKEYPNRPIQILVLGSPGGGMDTLTRLYSEQLKKIWNVPVNIINKPTAGGAVAAGEAANAEKDGYTFLSSLTGSMAAQSVSDPRGAVNLLRDFDTVQISYNYIVNALMTRSDSKFKSLEDVVDYARRNPGKLIFTVSQIGSPIHLNALLFKRSAKIDFSTLVFGSTSETLVNILGGHCDMGIMSEVPARPHIAAGKMRVVASVGKSSFPDVPTFSEKGYPQVNLTPSLALSGPKGLPPAVIKTWENAFTLIGKDAQFLASLEKMKFSPDMLIGSEKINELLKEEMERYSSFTPEELGWKK